MSVIHAPGKPRLDATVLIFPAVLAVLLLALLIRFWYVQIVAGPELLERSRSFGTIETKRLAPRGLIFDRNGRLVAGVRSQLVLTAIPEVVQKKPWVLDKVAALLDEAGAKNVDIKRLVRKTRDGIYRPSMPTPIYTDVPVKVAGKVAESADDLPGIGIESQAMRIYPDPVSFSHLLGYVWVPSPQDVERAKEERRNLAALVGKGGIEYTYERYLMGEEGFENYQLDARMRPARVAERGAATPGAALTLSLDADLQRVAIRALGSRRGAVVALDPNNGEVLCMASSPGFNLNLFRNGISQEDFQDINNNPSHPFLNRATNSAFAPGSTFKIVTAIAAMHAGVFNPGRTVYCSGGYRLGKQFYKCLGHHGAIAFREALERSCNTYFSDLAVRTGKDALRKTALELGFFSKTGIDLPSERSGLIPTDEWLARVKRPWVPGYTVLTGIGQGDVLTTPLQMANLAAMVSTNGTAYVPHLVRAVDSGHGPELVAHKPSREVDGNWQIIREAMIGVVEHGTAAGSRIPGLLWGGKTGSAEVFRQAKTNSWFIGFAPAVNPRIAICVMVEAVGHGSEFAAPIAKQVVQRYLSPAAVTNSPAALRANSASSVRPNAR